MKNIKATFLLVMALSCIVKNSFSQCSTTYPSQGTCSGCTNNPSGSITVTTANQTVCYTGTGTISTLTINANNVTVLICGSGSSITITNISGYGSGFTLLINSGATLTSTNAPYFLYGVGKVVNYGTFNANTSWTLSSGANLINASPTAIINFGSGTTLSTNGGIIYMNGGILNVPGTLKFGSNNTACFNNNAIINVGTLNVATSGPAVAVSSGNSSCISITSTYTSSNDPIVANSSPGTLNVCAQGSSSNYPSATSASWGGAVVTLNCNTQCNLILPTSFSDLLLTHTGTKIILNWSYYEEGSSGEFEIQRSGDGINFISIGAIPKTQEQNYSYTDYSLVTAMNYYRLKLIKADGSSLYSDVAKINIALPAEMKVISNLQQKNIQVILPQNSSNCTIRLLDIQGRLLKIIPIQGSSSIVNIESPLLTSGVYIVEFISSETHQAKQFYFSGQ